MNRTWRIGLAAASGALGAASVVVGAASAHSGLSYAAVKWVDIGLRYHLPHLVALWAALIACAPVAVRDAVAARHLVRAALAWGLGILGFCGGLYAQAFADLRMGAIVPMGAMALIVGWGYAALAAMRLARSGAE